MYGAPCIFPFYVSGMEYFECYKYGMDKYCPFAVADDGWEGYDWDKCVKEC